MCSNKIYNLIKYDYNEIINNSILNESIVQYHILQTYKKRN